MRVHTILTCYFTLFPEMFVLVPFSLVTSFLTFNILGVSFTPVYIPLYSLPEVGKHLPKHMAEIVHR